MKIHNQNGFRRLQTTVRDASFRRFGDMFEINLAKHFDKDVYMLVDHPTHIFKYKIFASLYEQNYYRAKSPQDIAAFLGRKTEDVMAVLLKLRPENFLREICSKGKT